MIRIGRILASSLAFAVTLCGPGPASAAFEDVEVSPQARALGSSGSALLSDSYAAFHNPASLAWAGRPLGAASYLRPFGYDFSSQGVFCGALALPRGFGGAGFGVRRFGVEYRGRTLTRETTLSLAHGFHLLRDHQSEVAVGWGIDTYALEYGQSAVIDQGTGQVRIDPGSASAIGIQVGGVVVLRERTRVGFTVANLNNPGIGDRDREELPRRLSAGVSYSPYAGVETVLDIANELGGPVQYRGGAQFRVSEFLVLRTGIHTEPSAFSAGFGLERAGLSLDYGFSTGGGVLGDTHHFGIGYALPERR
jgi:hypothetical protein